MYRFAKFRTRPIVIARPVRDVRQSMVVRVSQYAGVVLNHFPLLCDATSGRELRGPFSISVQRVASRSVSLFRHKSYGRKRLR
jgi:hypothetical protein